MTVYKDIRLLSPMAVEMIDQLIKGETVTGLVAFPLSDLTGDDTKTGDVMANFLEVVQVTADNVYEVIVVSCFQAYDDVYRDIPEVDRPEPVTCE